MKRDLQSTPHGNISVHSNKDVCFWPQAQTQPIDWKRHQQPGENSLKFKTCLSGENIGTRKQQANEMLDKNELISMRSHSGNGRVTVSVYLEIQ